LRGIHDTRMKGKMQASDTPSPITRLALTLIFFRNTGMRIRPATIPAR